MPQENIKSNAGIKSNINTPKKYSVILLNDDFTPMDFVVIILMAVFHYNQTDAERLMWQIHNEGRCVVGTYSKDIALSKIETLTKLARENGFPLRAIIREE